MIIELIKRTKSFVNKAKIMLIITIIALIAIGITQIVQETQSQELSLTGVEIKDVEGDWNIIDSFDEEILLDESWLINLNRVFNADEIKDIEIAKDDQLIPVEVKKYPEQKKIIVTPENYYLADESYTLNISLDNQNKYKMYFNTVGEDSGLIFEHKLTLEEDASNRPKMEVVIKNIQQDQLVLDVIGTVYDLILAQSGVDKELFEFIDYETMIIRNNKGEKLNYTAETRKTIKEEVDYVMNYGSVLYFDELFINTGSNQTIIIEYELVSNHELWEGFGGDVSEFKGPDEGHDPGHFWPVYLEWFIIRPQEQLDGLISNNTLEVNLPVEWKYVHTYPETEDGKIDLGELEYMRWNNDKQWKNYQKAPFVLFKEGPFLLESKEVAGTLIQDVYSQHELGIRNHEANHQFVLFLSEYIGELPNEKVLTFQAESILLTGSYIEHFSLYQLAPYCYGYSSMGGIWASGGGDLGQMGGHLQEPQKWSWDDPGFEKGYTHLPNMWSTARLWFGTFFKGRHGLVGGLPTYLGDLAIASYYTDWDVVENRFKLMYIHYLERVVQDDGSEKDSYNVGSEHSFFAYIKPALAFYYFDQRIQEESDGQKDFSHAVQYIYDEVLKGRDTMSSGNYEVDLLIEALYHTVEEGIDFDKKVKGYIYGEVYGHKFLDLSDYFDIDLDDYLQ